MTASVPVVRGGLHGVSRGKSRNAIDLDELVPVPKSRNPQQGARWAVRCQCGGDDVPYNLEIFSIPDHVDGRPYEMLWACAVVAQHNLKIVDSLFGLGAVVASADYLPIRVQRTCASSEQGCPGRHDGCVLVWNVCQAI